MLLGLFYYITLLPYLNNLNGRHKPLSFPVIYRLPVVSRHSCRFVVSSAVKFLCFIALSVSSSHFISGCHRRRLPPSEQVVSRLCPLLSSMHIECSYNFNTLFFSLSRILCVTWIFLWWLNFLLLIVWRSCSSSPKNPFKCFLFFCDLLPSVQISQTLT